MESRRPEDYANSARTPDTSHIKRAPKGKLRKKHASVPVTMVLVIVAIVIGVWLWHIKVDSVDAHLATPAATKTTTLTPEQELAKLLTDNSTKQISIAQENNGQKYITNSTAASSSVGRNLSTGQITASNECSTLSSFATTSGVTLATSKQVLLSTFNTELAALQTNWQIEDTALTATRSVGQGAFTDALTAYQARTGTFIKDTAARTSAANAFESIMLTSLQSFNSSIDVARANYQQDMSALIKAHQAALINLVNLQIMTITGALSDAKANCSNLNAVTTLTQVIAGANMQLKVNGAALDTTDTAKSSHFVSTRDGVFTQKVTLLASQSATAATTLGKSFQTR